MPTTAAPAAGSPTLPGPAVRSETLLARLQALADANRLRVLDALRDGERCVCRLTEGLDMAQPLLSHHLRVLKEAGLVSGRRDGRWIHYSIVPEALAELELILAGIRRDAEDAEPIRDRC